MASTANYQINYGVKARTLSTYCTTVKVFFTSHAPDRRARAVVSSRLSLGEGEIKENMEHGDIRLWAMVMAMAMGYGVMVWDIHGGYSYGDRHGTWTWALHR
jgi:hypothetical protein